MFPFIEYSRKVKAKWVGGGDLCVGAKDDKFGEFEIPETGIIITFELTYKNGPGIVTHHSYDYGYWGPDRESQDRLYIFVTDVAGNRIAPSNDYEKWVERQKVSFKIDHVFVTNKLLKLPETSIPRLTYQAGTKFRIWCGEDLTDDGDGDNAGEVCVDVNVVYRGG